MMKKKRFLSLALTVVFLFSFTFIGVYAKEKPNNDNTTDQDVEAYEEAPEDSSEPSVANPQDNLVQKSLTAVIQGRTVKYTSTTGTMLVESGGGQCEIFFIAYTKDDVKDLGERPITFAFNGGPGCASTYINFLCMGPKRMELDETGRAKDLPAKLVDNDNSLLDLTDLVFIDAIGTGYSRAIDDQSDFIGYNNDIRTIGDFIRLYANRNKRWESPIYIAGESYGTTRAVGLCDYLTSTYSMGINGIMLISSMNDFSTAEPGVGNDLPYCTFLPTYAADAWYHKRLDKKYLDMELEDFLKEVKDFVCDEYVTALFKGKSLKTADKNRIAVKMASYTGLNKDFILSKNLRVISDEFFYELLSDKKLVTGRYDGRFTGPVKSGNIYDGSSDPSTFDLELPLMNAINDCLVNELGYETDTPYIGLSYDVNWQWSYDSDNQYFAQEDIIRDCMTKNSKLKIWVLSGYYDGATPFYGAEWTFNHVYVDDSLKDNLTFTHYPSGHMFYLDKDSFDQFRKDAEKWYG